MKEQQENIVYSKYIFFNKHYLLLSYFCISFKLYCNNFFRYLNCTKDTTIYSHSLHTDVTQVTRRNYFSLPRQHLKVTEVKTFVFLDKRMRINKLYIDKIVSQMDIYSAYIQTYI